MVKLAVPLRYFRSKIDDELRSYKVNKIFGWFKASSNSLQNNRNKYLAILVPGDGRLRITSDSARHMEHISILD